MGRTSLFLLLILGAGCGGNVVIDTATDRSSLPLLWYPLDGDVKNAGSLGAAYDGVPTDLVWVPGNIRQGAEVGVGWIDLPGTREVLSGAPVLTIALWLQADFTPYGQPFMSCRSLDDGFDTQYRAHDGGQHGMKIAVCVDSDTPSDTTDNDPTSFKCGYFDVPDAGWHHILYRYVSTGPNNHTSLDIYLDGNHTARWPMGKVLFGSSVDDITLGRGHYTDMPGPSHHQLDDVRIYDKVFSEQEQCTQIVGGSWSNGTCQLP
jgi:hypothetical protein